jgi:hypothetical protein
MERRELSHFWLGAAALGALGIFAAGPAGAQDTSVPLSGFQQIFEPAAENGDAVDDDTTFGEHVGISGNWAIIGDREDDADGVAGIGAAYFYENVAGVWTFRQKVTGVSGAGQPPLTPEAEFGAGLAIHGDTAVVSAFRDNRFLSQMGSAFVYKLDNGVWTQTDNIGPGAGSGSIGGDAGDFFGGDSEGRSVDIWENRIAVGAFRTDDVPGEADSGALYIYEDATGLGDFDQVARLVPSDNATGDQFGYSTAISGDWAMAGAFRADEPGSQTGQAYAFKRDSGGNWTESQILLPSDVLAGDQFGARLALDGNLAVISSFRADDVNPSTNSQSGKAYIFELDTDTDQWVEAATLLPSDLTHGDFFGFDVDIVGETVVITAEFSDEVGTGASGSAYIFQKVDDVWTEVANFYPDVIAEGYNFGHSVAFDGTNLIFGTEPANNAEDSAFIATLADLLAGQELVGDLDGDGFVGITDLNIVLGAWNQSVPPGNALADPSGDGFVGIEDLNVVLSNWNAGTPPALSAVPEPTTAAVFAAGLLALRRRRQA